MVAGWSKQDAVASTGDGRRVRDARRLARASGRLRPFIPVAVVLTTLVALAVGAVLIERRITTVHGEITQVTDPARTTLNEIQLLLALETAGTRGYLLNGDERFRRGHLDARARRSAAVARLGLIARRTRPEVQVLAAQLSAQLRPADLLLDSLYGGTLSRETYMRRLPAQQTRFEAIVATLGQIDAIVAGNTARRVAQLEAAQHAALLTAVALAAIAAVAVLLVARLGILYRALAERETIAHLESELAREEADRRRLESERLSDSRARLVRGFTHDVKNPLGAAAGYLDLIEDGRIDPHEAARKARRAVKQGLELIDELLGIERDRLGEIAVRRRTFDLRALVLDAVEERRVAAEAKGLDLRAEIPDALPLIASDPERVRQILGNLISNAVRYTARGSVTVVVGTRPGSSGEPGSWATIDVRDTGPGLSAAQQRALFQEFRRLETAEGVAGSGLGLAISKRIAEALGGGILVESEPGVGSSFVLRLPCDAPAEAAPVSTGMEEDSADGG